MEASFIFSSSDDVAKMFVTSFLRISMVSLFSRCILRADAAVAKATTMRGALAPSVAQANTR